MVLPALVRCLSAHTAHRIFHRRRVSLGQVATLEPHGHGFPQAVFQEETVVLEPGDWLIVFSDGVSEAMSAAGDEYGEERILAVVDKQASLLPNDLLQAIFADVRAFTKGAPQSDDITALVLRYGPPA